MSVLRKDTRGRFIHGILVFSYCNSVSEVSFYFDAIKSSAVSFCEKYKFCLIALRSVCGLLFLICLTIFLETRVFLGGVAYRVQLFNLDCV